MKKDREYFNKMYEDLNKRFDPYVDYIEDGLQYQEAQENNKWIERECEFIDNLFHMIDKIERKTYFRFENEEDGMYHFLCIYNGKPYNVPIEGIKNLYEIC
jgi:hypothetical protein